MIAPNLATRPFLNTRPVWLLTAVAGIIALALLAANVHLYLAANEATLALVARENELAATRKSLEGELRKDITSLDQVGWKQMEARTDGVNVVLRERGFSWSAMLNDLERVLPFDVRLVQIAPTVNKDGIKLSLRGIARTRDAMLELLDGLIADPSFDDPLPSVENTPEDSSVPGYVFQLNVTYLPPEDVAAMAAEAALNAGPGAGAASAGAGR
jgi:type IV pilus assembly protein PilN